MTRTQLTYVVVAVCGVAGLGTFLGLILVPAWSAYTRVWQRLVAAVLSFYVLAAMIGIGLAGAALVVWAWGRFG